MDIKAKINEIVEKIKGDKNLAENFKNDPIKTVEGIIGMDIPDDQVKPLIDGIKAKLNLEKAGDVIGGIGDKIGGLFGKK